MVPGRGGRHDITGRDRVASPGCRPRLGPRPWGLVEDGRAVVDVGGVQGRRTGAGRRLSCRRCKLVFVFLEARNGLRLDSAVCYMIIIGLLGMGIDRLLSQLTKLPNVRWGYER